MAIQNLVVNGGFETGALSPWVSANTTITNQFSHTGTFSARLQGGAVTSYVGQFIPISAGEGFEFLVSLAKVGVAPAAPMTIQVFYFDSIFNLLGQGLFSDVPVNRIPTVDNSTWLENYQTTTLAPVGTTQAFILINNLPQGGTADVLVDDVALIAASGAVAPEVFEWGEETVFWADSSAPGPGTGTPFDPFNSLQSAITAATSSPFAATYGMRARLIILIAANSTFDENIVIPPARHVQLLGLGPWVLGNAALANFASSVPRNITIQTSQDAENFYLTQGVAFDARPVTVIGTINNGTSVSTHTNYTDGSIISGNVIFQNVAVVDPFTTIEFQLLNANVVGNIVQSGHMGILNTYMYNSRISNMTHNGLRIQRMDDSRSDGIVNVAGYSEITNSFINGNMTVTSSFADVPPTGIFSSQFGTITWTGPLTLDTASNYYFVNSGSTLSGTKTILFSLA